MSILITGTSETITVVLDAAPTTNQPHISASWADQAGTGGDASTLATGITAVTAVPAPAAGVSRVISGLTIYNADTADATVTIARKVSATSYTIAKVTLPAGFLLEYSNASGWKVLDQNGSLVQTVASSGGTGDVVGPAGAVSGNLAVFDGPTGNVLKDGGPVPSGVGVTRTMNEQTGTTYTLVLADANKDIRCTNAAAITLTIPKNTTVALPLLTPIAVFQGGAGVVTVVGATGVTIKTPFGAATTVIEDFRTLYQRATDIWVIG